MIDEELRIKRLLRRYTLSELRSLAQVKKWLTSGNYIGDLTKREYAAYIIRG